MGGDHSSAKSVGIAGVTGAKIVPQLNWVAKPQLEAKTERVFRCFVNVVHVAQTVYGSAATVE